MAREWGLPSLQFKCTVYSVSSASPILLPWLHLAYYRCTVGGQIWWQRCWMQVNPWSSMMQNSHCTHHYTLLLPDSNSAVKWAGSKHLSKLRVGPGYPPNWPWMALEEWETGRLLVHMKKHVLSLNHEQSLHKISPSPTAVIRDSNACTRSASKRLIVSYQTHGREAGEYPVQNSADHNRIWWSCMCYH